MLGRSLFLSPGSSCYLLSVQMPVIKISLLSANREFQQQYNVKYSPEL